MSKTPNATSVAKINGVNIVAIENGEKWVPIKPICEAIGIDFQKQIDRIKADEILGELYTVRYMVAADGKEREMATIPFKFAFGWLFSIQANKVAPERREFVIKYKLECYNALYNHFAELDEYLRDRARMVEEKAMAMEQLREEFKNAKSNLDIAREEFHNVRAMTFDVWRSMRTQTSIDFPEDQKTG